MMATERERLSIANLAIGAVILGLFLWFMAGCTAPARNADGSVVTRDDGSVVTVGDQLADGVDSAAPAIASGLSVVNPLLGLLAIPFLGAGAAALRKKPQPKLEEPPLQPGPGPPTV